MSKIYNNGNQKRAKSLAPRTPYLRTKGVFEMSDVFIGFRRLPPGSMSLSKSLRASQPAPVWPGAV